jgi:hypothetical protein
LLVGVVGLTKAEIVGCLPLGWIRPMDARKWNILEDAILKLSDKMKGVIYEAGRTKDCLVGEMRKEVGKRKMENFQWVRRTRSYYSVIPLRVGDGRLK